MSGISGTKACLRIVRFSLAILGMAFCICNARAADISKAASNQSPVIKSVADSVDSQEVPVGPLMFYATISTIVASSAALILAVITFAHLAKTNKKISQVQTNPSAISQQQKLTEAIDLISAIEHRLDSLEKRINQRLGQWDKYEERLNAAEAETERAGRRLSQNYTALQQANVRLDAVSRDIEALEMFKDSVRTIRDRIIDAFGPSQTNVQQDAHPVTEVQADEAEKDSVTTDEPKDEIAEADNSNEESATDIMKYYYPGRTGSEFSG